MKRVLGISVISLAIALLLTGCTSGGKAADSSSTAPSSASSVVTSAPATASSSTASTAGTVASTASAASSAALGNGACTQAQLTATTGSSNAGAGQQALAIIFTNRSSTSCSVQGFPGAAGLDGSGKQVRQAARLGGPGATLTVAPNASVSATVFSANIPSGSDPDQTCAPFAGGLAVTPPNTTTTVSLTDKADQMSDCGLKITPVAAGAAGNPNGN